MKIFTLLLTLVFCSITFFSCTENKAGEVLSAAVPSLMDSIVSPVDIVETEETARIDSFFKKLHQTRGFNGTVLISRHGKIIYKNALGYANIKTKDPLTVSSSFQLASVSKQFTAMAIMMLKERGSLKYDDDIQYYLPDFPYEHITIRELLCHRSGLPNYMYFCDQYLCNSDTFVSNAGVISLMKQYRPAAYRRPNLRHQYSNTGYCILAAIIEKVSGIPYKNFIESHIFKRLKMENSFVCDFSENEQGRHKAIGYEVSGRRLKEAGTNYLDGVVGDKGIYSTVEDLFRWDQALYTDKLICSSTLEEAFTPANRDLKQVNYGFGWRIYNSLAGDKIVYHKGWWHGFNACFTRDLKNKSSVIILSNIVNGSFGNIKELDDILKLQPPLTQDLPRAMPI